MGLKMKNIITVLFLGCYSLVFTQFNTLTPKKVTSNEILKEQQSFQKQSTFKIEKEQKALLTDFSMLQLKKSEKGD